DAVAIGLVVRIGERELVECAEADRIGYAAGVADIYHARVVAPRLGDMVLFLFAVQCGEGQVVGQVAGVLADVQLAAVFVVVAAVLYVDGLEDVRTGVVVGIGSHGLLSHVGDPGELKQVVVIDVPVQLCQPARNFVVALLVAGTGIGTGG